MKRREFNQSMLTLGLGARTGFFAENQAFPADKKTEEYYEEAPKRLRVRRFDVAVAGAGTAGVVAALAAARTGANTVLIEVKGYPGGTVTEGGTALHSYYNLWKEFGVEKRQVVKGIAQEIIDRLIKVGGTSGHAEMSKGYGYDSVCTAVDTELFKLVTFEMLVEAGVFVCVNTLVAGAIRKGSLLQGVIVESRSGREAFYAKSFIDCTAYGDLCAYAGAKFSEPNDYPVVNSIGLANVSVEKLRDFLDKNNAVTDLAYGRRSGKEDQIVRIGGTLAKIPGDFSEEASKIGLSMVTTTVHDNYFMFIKLNIDISASPTDRDVVAKAELDLRQRQFKAMELFRKYVPGCEKAFIARTSPKLCIRRGRLIKCDYDITLPDIIEARHFDDDVMAYGFHDSAPRLQIRNGGTYGIPYRSLRVTGIENLLAAGMLITSDHEAHMSTRNTVCCFGQGQAAGTAAALCVKKKCGTRELSYGDLRRALEKGNVYFEK